MREKIQAQERRDTMKNLRAAQKDQEERDDNDIKNQIRIQKAQDAKDDAARNVGLYKTKSKIVQPVPMKH